METSKDSDETIDWTTLDTSEKWNVFKSDLHRTCSSQV